MNISVNVQYIYEYVKERGPNNLQNRHSAKRNKKMLKEYSQWTKSPVRKPSHSTLININAYNNYNYYGRITQNKLKKKGK